MLQMQTNVQCLLFFTKEFELCIVDRELFMSKCKVQRGGATQFTRAYKDRQKAWQPLI